MTDDASKNGIDNYTGLEGKRRYGPVSETHENIVIGFANLASCEPGRNPEPASLHRCGERKPATRAIIIVNVVEIVLFCRRNLERIVKQTSTLL